MVIVGGPKQQFVAAGMAAGAPLELGAPAAADADSVIP
jgi:hypothetical protein